MFQTRLDELLSQSGFGPTANTARSTPEAPTVPPDFEEIFQQVMDAWTATATEVRLEAPTEDQVKLALSVGPGDAIRRGFSWASAPEEVEGLINIYLTVRHRAVGQARSTPTRLWSTTQQQQPRK